MKFLTKLLHFKAKKTIKNFKILNKFSIFFLEFNLLLP